MTSEKKKKTRRELRPYMCKGASVVTIYADGRIEVKTLS